MPEAAIELSALLQTADLARIEFEQESGGEFRTSTSTREKKVMSKKAITGALRAIASLKSERPDPSCLLQFQGWGNCKDLFSGDSSSAIAQFLLDEPSPSWLMRARQQLKELLTPAEWHQARGSALTSYYTPPHLIDALWKAVHKIGFDRGKILEPGCGRGDFISRSKIEDKYFIGIESEPISAAIASALNPNATIYNKPFEKIDFPDGYFDLAIGNVPFGSYRASDPRYAQLGGNIHEYFLAKSLNLVREGGIAAFILPASLFQRKNPSFRRYIGGYEEIVQVPLTKKEREIARERDKLSEGKSPSTKQKKIRYGGIAKLVELIWLPDSTFEGTQAQAAIAVFQKNERGDFKLWTETTEIALNFAAFDRDRAPEKVRVNCFFERELRLRQIDGLNRLVNDKGEKFFDEPHRFLGSPDINPLYGDGLSCADSGCNVAADIAAIFKWTPTVYGQPAERGLEGEILSEEMQELREGEFVLHEGSYHYREGALLKRVLASIEFTYRGKKYVVDRSCERIADFIRLAEATERLARAQSDPAPIAPLQTVCRIFYSTFIRRWGHFKQKGFNANEMLLSNDPRYALTAELERWNGDRLVTSPILTERVGRVYNEPERCDNPRDAIVASLNRFGHIEIDYVAKLLGDTVERLSHYLAHKQLAFFDPVSGWAFCDEYLSGNLRDKLDAARTYRGHADLSPNIKALQAALPKPILPRTTDRELAVDCLEALDIPVSELDERELSEYLDRRFTVELGATWIAPEVYARFARERLDIKIIEIRYWAEIATFFLAGDSRDHSHWGTEDLHSLQILECALNLKRPRIVKRFGDGNFDYQRSELANRMAVAKIEDMNRAFVDWIWGDRKRTIDLCTAYNVRLNSCLPRQYTGEWLALPGLNPEIELYPWQRRGIARILQSQSTFLSWCVGSGKTLTLIAAAEEMLRLDMARRPLIVVLNGTEGQFMSEWKIAYPASNATLCPRNKKERTSFLASLPHRAPGAIVMTHSQFFMLHVSREYQLAFLNAEKDRLVDALRMAAEQNHRHDDTRRTTERGLQQHLKRLEAKITKVLASNSKHEEFDFETLGVDAVLFDEFHVNKRLPIQTKQQGVRGIPSGDSQRAIDTYCKLAYTLGQFFADLKHEVRGKVVAATGTMLSNTIAEIYVWQRMLQLPLLEKMGLVHFDAWSSQFVEISSDPEVKPDGRYEMTDRMKSFYNIRVLRSHIEQFVDFFTAKDLDDAAIVAKPMAHYVDCVSQPSEAQKQFLKKALLRAVAIRNRQISPQEDNMLVLTTDLIKASLSVRLLGWHEPQLDNKIHALVLNVGFIYRETNGTQLVFCDLSTDKGDSQFSAYRYIRELLTACGIPAETIEYAQDHKSIDRRNALRDRVNRGEVRIVIGSTATLGTGCNFQEWGLHALHHLDAPHRPTDLEQREGRGIRQGNGKNQLGEDTTLAHCIVFRYITERLDSLRWQALQNKRNMIVQFFEGRDIDELLEIAEEERPLTYEEVKALATGNPLLTEDARLRKELDILLARQHQFNTNRSRAVWDLKAIASQIKGTLQKIDTLEELSSIQGDPKPKDKLQFFGMEPCEVSLGDTVRLGHTFRAVANQLKGRRHDIYPRICKLGNLAIAIEHSTIYGYAFVLVASVPPSGENHTIRLRHLTGIKNKDYDIKANSTPEEASQVGSQLQKIFRFALRDRRNYLIEVASHLNQKQLKMERQQIDHAFPQSDRILEVRERLEEIARLLENDRDILDFEETEVLPVVYDGGDFSPTEFTVRYILHKLGQYQPDWASLLSQTVVKTRSGVLPLSIRDDFDDTDEDETGDATDVGDSPAYGAG